MKTPIIKIEDLDPKRFIIIKNARVHNLKNLSVAIPRNKLVVITGLSGSVKSSLAFDTLFAEGQRRYVEILSSYARQFIGRMDKPDVDYIRGIAPAIAIEQKVNTRNPRSTVGTSTEIYDFMKLLFARIGKTYSPISGNLVKRDTITSVSDALNEYPNETKIIIYSPLYQKPTRSLIDELKGLVAKGFSRVLYNKETMRIEDLLNNVEFNKKSSKKGSPSKKNKSEDTDINVLIDRIVIDKNDDENLTRISDSLQTAFLEGEGKCIVDIIDDKTDTIKTLTFANKFESDGITFEEPSVHLFSFNNPYGACKTCEGFGTVIGIDENLIIPDKSLSVYDGAIVCWRGEKMKEWNDKLVQSAYKFDFPLHRSYYDLTDEEKHLLWTGNKYFEGLNAFFKYLEAESFKIQYRVMLSRYRGKTICPDCKGSRLRIDASYVKIAGKSIIDLVLMSGKELLPFFKNLKLNDYDKAVGERLLTEIKSRLQFMNDVGLNYLTLNRLSNTLSGGESQRINLATSLGSSLVGSMYILDEPSIGLHSKDTEKLIKVLKSLRDLGNTVIVVEHDEEIMNASDQLIDIGPLAGTDGGELVFQGTFKEMVKDTDSLTAKYLKGFEKIEVPAVRRKWHKYIK
ncbi:MAG: excinuclease ABC subunit A, partial [Bacteroidota bacterium]